MSDQVRSLCAELAYVAERLPEPAIIEPLAQRLDRMDRLATEIRALLRPRPPVDPTGTDPLPEGVAVAVGVMGRVAALAVPGDDGQ